MKKFNEMQKGDFKTLKHLDVCLPNVVNNFFSQNYICHHHVCHNYYILGSTLEMYFLCNT